MQADVLVIGAGAAGLMAARSLLQRGKKVIIAEARARMGGRIHTITHPNFEQAVEAGAEFVHGPLPLTQQLLAEAGLRTTPAGGAIWRSSDNGLHPQDNFIEDEESFSKKLHRLKEDMSVADFIDQNLSGAEHKETVQSLRSYVEGYYAGDIHKASALALKEEWEETEEDDQRIIGGYGELMDHLFAQCSGAQIHFNTTINLIQWQQGSITATATNGELLQAKRVLVTVPVGVLQRNMITFEPAIPNTKAAKDLGFGAVIKIALHCTHPFWLDDYAMKDLAFLFSDESVPTWWTQQPQKSNLLTGWCTGPGADAVKHLSDEALYEKAVQSLAHCFALTTEKVKEKISAWRVFNWASDPCTFGGYSYAVVAGQSIIDAVAQPVADTIYFAGEGLHWGSEIGTVEAALQSGQKVAQHLLQQLE